jgi:opacity protein-like surface antigen
LFNKNKQTLLNSFMKKLFALLLLPSIAFAGKIGENYVGAKIGQGATGLEISGVDFDWDGFAFKLNGNYNFYSDAKYGTDLNIDFISGSSLDGPVGTKADVSKFEGVLRPYMIISEITLFANLGVVAADLEIKADDFTGKIDKTIFSPGVGIEFSLDKLSVAPSIDWVDFDSTNAKGIFVTIPASYAFQDNISITLEYEMASFDSFDTTIDGDDVRAEYIYDSLMVGIDYKF